MKLLFSVRAFFKGSLILGLGYALGFIFGSALPSPGYIPHLANMPLLMNTPTDVSDYVAEHLPIDPQEAFDIVASSSRSVSSSYGSECSCVYFSFKRIVRRFPIPERELTIWFRVEGGELKYRGASIVFWFL